MRLELKFGSVRSSLSDETFRARVTAETIVTTQLVSIAKAKTEGRPRRGWHRPAARARPARAQAPQPAGGYESCATHLRPAHRCDGASSGNISQRCPEADEGACDATQMSRA
jgi:hypothetical protein